MFAEMHQTAVSFVSGGVAGAAATLGSYPFDLLRTTLAAQGLPKVPSRYCMTQPVFQSVMAGL